MKLKPLKIADLYIIKEVSYPFLIGVLITTIILLSNYLFQLTDLIIVKNVPILLVLRLLLYQLPEIIVRTFPIAILFAIMTGMGRFSQENEFTAFLMGGISLYRLILPVLMVGLIVSGFTFFMNEDIVPWANHEAQNIIRQTILKEVMPNLKEEVFFKGPNGRLFYVKSYDEKAGIINNVIIYDFVKNKDYPEVITANKGQIKENTWELEEGIIHTYADSGHLVMESRFDRMDIKLTDDMKNFFGEQRTPSEMSRQELKKEIKLFLNSGINVDSLLVEYHLKLAQSFTALIFVLIGTPLSLANKESRTLSIIFTIVIIFSYYLILSVSRSLGRNHFLPPLLAAWLPNLFYLGLGLIIIIWQESWRNIIHRLWPGFLIISLIFTGISVQAAGNEDVIKLEGGSLNYQSESGLITLTKNVGGHYDKFYLHADQIIIKLKDGGEKSLFNPEEIKILPGEFTGCDLNKPHYYFDARKVIIYPGDYLEAYHVVFKELNGKLPLFYWPYLYISLKDREQKLIPEFGYSQQRGWFVKTTYNYSLKKRLPGELYLDYYTISGLAGGFKQYFIYQPAEKASYYLYGQDNKTDIPGLFNWQTAIAYENTKGKWQTDSLIEYSSYDDSYLLDGEINLENDYQRRRLNLQTDFNLRDYYQSDNYDRRKLDLNFDYQNTIIKNLDLNLGYDIELDLDPDEGLNEENSREIKIDYDWGQDWELSFQVEQEELKEPDEPDKTRWSSKNFIAKDLNDLNFKLLWERYDPKFSVEDEVSFYRWPELTTTYNPPGDFKYHLQLGKYYEDRSGSKGYRAEGQINYRNYWRLNSKNILRTDIDADARFYNLRETDISPQIPYQYVYDSFWKLTSRFTNNLLLNNTYEFRTYTGESPFTFDHGKNEEIIKNNLRYYWHKFDFKLESGYQFHDQEFLPLQAIVGFKPIQGWNMRLGVVYDLNNQEFDKDLVFTNNLKNKKWLVQTAVRYDLNENQLHELDNKLQYEISGDYGWYLENNLSLDYDKSDPISEANLLLKKKLHCRELWFSYDYINQEFTIQYQLDLFPAHGIKFGSSRDNPFMFDLGVEELLNND